MDAWLQENKRNTKVFGAMPSPISVAFCLTSIACQWPIFDPFPLRHANRNTNASANTPTCSPFYIQKSVVDMLFVFTEIQMNSMSSSFSSSSVFFSHHCSDQNPEHATLCAGLFSAQEQKGTHTQWKMRNKKTPEHVPPLNSLFGGERQSKMPARKTLSLLSEQNGRTCHLPTQKI